MPIITPSAFLLELFALNKREYFAMKTLGLVILHISIKNIIPLNRIINYESRQYYKIFYQNMFKFKQKPSVRTSNYARDLRMK